MKFAEILRQNREAIEKSFTPPQIERLEEIASVHAGVPSAGLYVVKFFQSAHNHVIRNPFVCRYRNRGSRILDVV